MFLSFKESHSCCRYLFCFLKPSLKTKSFHFTTFPSLLNVNLSDASSDLHRLWHLKLEICPNPGWKLAKCHPESGNSAVGGCMKWSESLIQFWWSQTLAGRNALAKLDIVWWCCCSYSLYTDLAERGECWHPMEWSLPMNAQLFASL